MNKMLPNLSQESHDKENERMDLEWKALEIFFQVVAEWNNDPMSIQCFDLAIVNKAKHIARSLNQHTLYRDM